MIVKNKTWNFIAASFNARSDKNILVVNEGFGHENGLLEYFNLDNYDWIPKVFTGQNVGLGGENMPGNMNTFDGSISCLQIFDYSMDLAMIQMKKNCPDVTVKAEKCPLNYHYFDGMCYGAQSAKYSFSQAEAICLPKFDSPHEIRLAFSKNLEHLDFISHVAKENTGSLSTWIGLADKNEDEDYLTR